MPFCNFVQTYKMQRLILIILSSFFLLLSCGPSKPKGTLSIKKMANLMTDIHLVDGYLNTLPIDSTRKVIDGLYQEVFENYDIDSVQFKTNIAYYLGNPIISKDLYAAVTKKLTAYEDDYRRADSIENARVADSMQVARRYLRLRDEAQRLILEVDIDTIPLSYKLHQHDFMKGAELQAVQLYQPVIRPDAPSTMGEEETKIDQIEKLSVDSGKAVPAETSVLMPPKNQKLLPIRTPRSKKVEIKPLEN